MLTVKYKHVFFCFFLKAIGQVLLLILAGRVVHCLICVITVGEALLLLLVPRATLNNSLGYSVALNDQTWQQ